jgi:hypothetical protein
VRALSILAMFLLASAGLGLGLLILSLGMAIFRARRWAGVLLRGTGGALAAGAAYVLFFLGSGGHLSESLNEVVALWALAGFGWVGSLAALRPGGARSASA